MDDMLAEYPDKNIQQLIQTQLRDNNEQLKPIT